MKTSVCITIFNEGNSIANLLNSLLIQTIKPDEIVIVDSESTDNTSEIIRHHQKKDSRIKFWVQKSTRSEGRNLAIEIAKNDIIAITDAGCIADKNWLKNITTPFKHWEVEMVAGFYRMIGKNSFQKAEAVFLGIMPDKFNIHFLPSARSIALRKSTWERLGGFPEKLNDTAEDTLFVYSALKNKMKIARVKNAIVEWGMPETLTEFSHKIYSYAKGDAKSKIWKYPVSGLTSHNIKLLLIIMRYFLGSTLLVYSLFHSYLLPIPVILIITYFYWSFRKVYSETKEILSGLWGIILQITSDIFGMKGFLEGLLFNNR